MLCRLCRSISSADLPAFPSSYHNPGIGWEHIHVFQPNANKKARRPFGFPHQPDLQSLRSSAPSCELCRLILASTDQVIAEFLVAKKKKSFVNNHDYGHPTFNLYLTKRRDCGDGFWVLSNSTVRDSVYLLAAVGLSARDGKTSRRRGEYDFQEQDTYDVKMTPWRALFRADL
jgi:hypothetical protein